MSKKHTKKQQIACALSAERTKEPFPAEKERTPVWAENEWNAVRQERVGRTEYLQYLQFASRPGSKRMRRGVSYATHPWMLKKRRL